MAYSFKGNLSFGFVYIPVTLHLAIQDSGIPFRLFDRKTKSKIQYKKTCLDCDGREVKNEDLIRGYEYEEGKFVMFSDEDFEKIKTKKDKNITIEQFVSLEELDPLYFEKSYYMVPTGAEKAYCLLMKAMEEEKKAGLGKTVLGTKESLVLIRAVNGYLLLSTLHFQEEIRKYPAAKEKAQISSSELRLAKLLIREMTSPFDPSVYEDEYAKKVRKAIEAKVKGNKIVAPKEKRQTRIPDLMEALRTSLDQFDPPKSSGTKKAKKKSTKQAPASQIS